MAVSNSPNGGQPLSTKGNQRFGVESLEKRVLFSGSYSNFDGSIVGTFSGDLTDVVIAAAGTGGTVGDGGTIILEEDFVYTPFALPFDGLTVEAAAGDDPTVAGFAPGVPGVYVTGDDVAVDGLTFTDLDIGVEVEDAVGGYIKHNTFDTSVNTGVLLDNGDDVTIKRNTFDGTTVAVDLTDVSTGNTVRDNTADGVSVFARTDTFSDSNTFNDNTASGTLGRAGFDINSFFNSLERNRVSFFDDGIKLGQTGSVNFVGDNFATGNNNGFTIDGSGNLIDDNDAILNNNKGFEVNGSDNTLTDNLALANGDGNGDQVPDTPFAGGFDINGDRNDLAENASAVNANDGFSFDGDSNSSDSDLAVGNLRAGLSVSGNFNDLGRTTDDFSLFNLIGIGSTGNDNSGLVAANVAAFNVIDRDIGGSRNT